MDVHLVPDWKSATEVFCRIRARSHSEGEQFGGDCYASTKPNRPDEGTSVKPWAWHRAILERPSLSDHSLNQIDGKPSGVTLLDRVGWRPVSPRLYRTPKRAAPRRLDKRRLDRLVEEAIIDAYGESEQRVGFLSMLQMNLVCPFVTEVLGTAVSVERIDLNAADEIVAVCRRGRQRQLIPILDLRLLSPRPAGWEWIEAYRHWARGGR